MDSSASKLDCYDGVQEADCGLKGLEVRVLVRENAEYPRIDPKADTGVNVLLSRLEPSVTLGLRRSVREETTMHRWMMRTCLKI